MSGLYYPHIFKIKSYLESFYLVLLRKNHDGNHLIQFFHFKKRILRPNQVILLAYVTLVLTLARTCKTVRQLQRMQCFQCQRYEKEEGKKTSRPLPKMNIFSSSLCVTQEEDTGLGNRVPGSGKPHSAHSQPSPSQRFLQMQGGR